MRILVIGGGPAGLAFSMLMAETDPKHHITVLERSEAHENPGWGVTLRVETLSFLDLEDLIGSSLQTLQGRALRYRNTLVVDLPNPAQSSLRTLSRSALLKALYQRVEELGVKLLFAMDGARLTDAVLASFDLVIAADGANSTIRLRYTAAFQPHIELGKNWYVWLATEMPFHKLTILLVDDPVPLLAWGYKYTPTHSTFIVEMAEEAGRSSGILRGAPEDSCRRLATAFKRELGGHSILFGKNLCWHRYATVSCRKWCHRHIALIGEAAHTAHFSQGFGTMQAFEDALALHAAFSNTTDVECALEAYEQVQRPKVGLVQQTASASMNWGESILESAERHDEKRVSELIAARWQNNSVTAGPLGLSR